MTPNHPQTGVGGQIHAFVATLPKLGSMALTLRDPTVGERDNQDALQPESKQWAKLGEKAAEHQVGVDLFVLAQTYVDVASLGQLCRTTGGQLYHYGKFDAQSDTAQLFNDLRWSLMRPQVGVFGVFGVGAPMHAKTLSAHHQPYCVTRNLEQGLEAIARLRVSNGLAVDRYMGALYQRTSTDVEFPVVTSDTALVALLTHEEKLPDSSQACVQFALLYTTTDGHRRVRCVMRDGVLCMYVCCVFVCVFCCVCMYVRQSAYTRTPPHIPAAIHSCFHPLHTSCFLCRAVPAPFPNSVHTLSLPTTSSLGTVFKGADLDSVLAHVARKTAASLPGSTLTAARDAVTKTCVDMLAAYRKHCASTSPSGQLILPESLKLLPLYALGLIKSGLLRCCSAHTCCVVLRHML